MTEWNPDDPDATRVYYDVSAWNFDQQAELAAAMADAAIPHGWLESELIVPVEHEDVAEMIINEVEQRLGVRYPDSDLDPVERGADVELVDGSPMTEFDRSDASEGENDVVTGALTSAGIAFRWEGDNLVVATADEALVDALLDDIESGEYIDVEGSGGSDDSEAPGEAPSAEVLTAFFLAAERLRRNPHDASGLKRLSEATSVSDPRRPPFGVQPRLWEQTCDAADALADALTDENGTDDEVSVAAAEHLHDLLRPYI